MLTGWVDVWQGLYTRASLCLITDARFKWLAKVRSWATYISRSSWCLSCSDIISVSKLTDGLAQNAPVANVTLCCPPHLTFSDTNFYLKNTPRYRNLISTVPSRCTDVTWLLYLFTSLCRRYTWWRSRMIYIWKPDLLCALSMLYVYRISDQTI